MFNKGKPIIISCESLEKAQEKMNYINEIRQSCGFANLDDICMVNEKFISYIMIVKKPRNLLSRVPY